MGEQANPGPDRPRAWRSEWMRWPGCYSIVAAYSRGTATYGVFMALRDVYARDVVFLPDIRTSRAPEYDAWARLSPPHRVNVPTAEHYVRTSCLLLADSSSPLP